MARNLTFKTIMLTALLGVCFPGPKTFAQFSGPTPLPAEVDTTESFSTQASGKAFLWTFENTPIDFFLTSMPALSYAYNNGTALSSPVYVTFDVDNGQWYSFVTNYSSLSSGTYFYSFVVDGHKLSTKKMVVIN